MERRTQKRWEDGEKLRWDSEVEQVDVIEVGGGEWKGWRGEH